MNIAISQLNLRIADFESSFQRITDHIRLAEEGKADLIIFPELVVGGSPAYDFLKSPAFLAKAQDFLYKIPSHCSIECIFGMPYFEALERKLYNAAVYIRNQEIIKTVKKKHLKDKGEILETPYFAPGSGPKVIKSGKRRILLGFNEDLLTYSLKKKADLIVSLNNRPFSYLEHEARLKVLSELSERFHLPIIEINQTGAQGSLIFDGRSTIINADGSYFDELNAFEEDLRIYSFSHKRFEALQPKQEITSYSEPALIHKALVTGIRDYFTKSGFSKALIGLSGGLDSALVAALACEALGAENVKGILMPSMYSTDHSIKDAVDLAENLGCAYEVVPIKQGFDTFQDMLEPIFKGAPEDVTEQNIQARVRAVILMAISNKQGYIVLNTSNKSEAAMGYGTLYGDLIGSLSVLGDVYKTQVIGIAKHINREKEIIPLHTIVKPPSAELMPGQKDSDSLPLYEILDPILFQLIEKGESRETVIQLGHNEAEVDKVLQIMSRVGFKLFQTPPALRVSPRAFGSGYQMPLVSKLS